MLNERTDLDAYSNMVVFDKNCYIVKYPWKATEALPFSPECKAWSKVPIVDAIVPYYDPYSGKNYMLMCKEATSVQDM